MIAYQHSTVPSSSSEEIRRAAAFLTRLLPEPRALEIRLWDGSVIPSTDKSKLTVVINSPSALRRMFRLPVELSLGQAYLRGDFDLEGEIWQAGPALEASRNAAGSLGEILALTRLWCHLPYSKRQVRKETGYGGAPAQVENRKYSREWDQEGIQYHYDAGNDFFALFLDKRMVYSCAYFPTGMERLDEAQEHKFEHICRKLRLKEGEKLLDIGCGWGALPIHAAKRYGVRALGVTLSTQQYELAQRKIVEAAVQNRVQVRCMDYRDVQKITFDKVVSVGMFEHVGRKRLPEYFNHVYRILKPGGLFLNHGIAGRARDNNGLGAAVRERLESLLIGGTTFRQRYVFPSGGLTSVSETNLIAQRAGFEVRDVENLREHYALTLRCWAQRLEKRKEEAIRLGGERMYRLWRLYMGIASWQFERGEFDLGQTLLLRPIVGPSGLPLTRAHLYA